VTETNTPKPPTPSEPPTEPSARILFCTDFSDTADRAFDRAIDSAVCRPGSQLILLHVIPEPDAQFWRTYIYEVNGVDEKARGDVDAKIAETYAPRVPDGVTFRVEVRIGSVPDEILAFAKKEQVSLIIVGRRGHSSLTELVFGAVADKIVRRARCPVLVVPEARK